MCRNQAPRFVQLDRPFSILHPVAREQPKQRPLMSGCRAQFAIYKVPAVRLYDAPAPRARLTRETGQGRAQPIAARSAATVGALVWPTRPSISRRKRVIDLRPAGATSVATLEPLGLAPVTAHRAAQLSAHLIAATDWGPTGATLLISGPVAGAQLRPGSPGQRSDKQITHNTAGPRPHCLAAEIASRAGV